VEYLPVDLALTRSSLRGAFLVPWLLAALLSASAPTPALAQASQATPSQQPQSTAPKPEAATPGPRNGQKFQDWTLSCRAEAGNAETCRMQQEVVNQKGNQVLLAVVGRLRSLNEPAMLILLPLGIALPPGVFLKIDDGEQQRVEINLCEKQGCRIELVLKPDLLAQLKAGTKAIVSFHVFDQQGKQPEVDVPVSLLGFSAALGEVMK
jgi:invasion protein IalB